MSYILRNIILNIKNKIKILIIIKNEYLNENYELGLHQGKPTVPKLRSRPDRRGRESEGDESIDVSIERPEVTRTKAMETSESI